MKINVVFDNGGGTTIMADVNGKSYTRYYNDPEIAAQDYAEMLKSDCDFDDWDGNDPDAAIEYDNDMERNGGYRWADHDDIAEPSEKLINWGYNTQKFFAAMEVI
jgi:hypothetical protein